MAIYMVHIYTVYTSRTVQYIINARIQANGPIMPNKAHFDNLQPLLHSLKDNPGSVHAYIVIGGVCVLRHVTKWEFGRIGPPLTLASLYCCSSNPRLHSRDRVKAEGLGLHLALVQLT